MEILNPVNDMDFDFNSARSTPHVSTPSSPKRFGDFYCSAPSSPSRISQYYRDFDDYIVTSGCSGAAVPFEWEEKPSTPKSLDDFAFDVGEEAETASLSAEELFDGGVIKPLKPQPRLQLPARARISENNIITTHPKSPLSRGTRIIKGAFSPRHKREYSDNPFAVASQNSGRAPTMERERGRERNPYLSSSSRRTTRSVSPLRVSQYPWDEENQQQQQQQQQKNLKSSSSSICSTLSSSLSKNHKKWRLMDFFLFRSASEGRAADKDPLKKYTAVFKRYEDVKTSSFRTIDSPGSGSVSGSRRRGPISAHELHYTVNRSVSEDLKKKTFLPYKQGILGRLAFNPAVHALANGFGFSQKRNTGHV